MQRKFAISTLLALVLVLGLAVTAMAAGPGPNMGKGAGGAGQGAAIHGTFVDADGDGTCDNYAVREPAQDGAGNQWGAGQGKQAGYGSGANFADEDGDGVCDNCLGSGAQLRNGAGKQIQRSNRWNR